MRVWLEGCRTVMVRRVEWRMRHGGIEIGEMCEERYRSAGSRSAVVAGADVLPR